MATMDTYPECLNGININMPKVRMTKNLNVHLIAKRTSKIM